jgi:hypothetical protein
MQIVVINVTYQLKLSLCAQGAGAEEVRQAIRPYCLEVVTVLTAGGVRFR